MIACLYPRPDGPYCDYPRTSESALTDFAYEFQTLLRERGYLPTPMPVKEPDFKKKTTMLAAVVTETPAPVTPYCEPMQITNIVRISKIVDQALVEYPRDFEYLVHCKRELAAAIVALQAYLKS